MHVAQLVSGKIFCYTRAWRELRMQELLTTSAEIYSSPNPKKHRLFQPGLRKEPEYIADLSEIVVPPAKKKIALGDAKTSLLVISIAKSQMFLSGTVLAFGCGLRRYFPAYLVAIMTSFTNPTRTIFAAHLLHCTDSEQFIFHQH